MVFDPWDNLTTLEEGANAHVPANENYLILASMMRGCFVLSRLSTPPGSPTSGDMHIVTATATGAWLNREDHIAFFDEDSWKFVPGDAGGTPRVGWSVWVEEEDSEFTFLSTGWAANEYPITKFTRPLILDRDLTAPPGSPANGDAYIPAATATGAWAGFEDDIVIFYRGVWRQYVPSRGTRVTIDDEVANAAWNGTAWVKVSVRADDNTFLDLADLTTTDATLTSILERVIPTDTIVQTEGSLQAIEADASDGALFHFRHGFRDDGGTPTDMGALKTPEKVADTPGSYTLTIDEDSGNLRVRVTGVAATTIAWRLRSTTTHLLAPA